MARFIEPTEDEETGWKEWVASRPPNVKAVAELFEPWSLYRLKTTAQRVTLLSFDEDENGSVTLSVAVTGVFNRLMHDRAVFGVAPGDLEPCELPDAAEVTGSAMSSSQVEDNIDAMRVLVRPDLWILDEDGRAVRRN